MHTGRSYKLSDFLYWTRRSIFWLLLLGTVPTVLYQVFDCRWLSIPWPAVAFLGTATAFIVGFKNVQTYNRTWDARQIWGAAMSASRSWAVMCRDYMDDSTRSRQLIYRQFAWITALRYQLRAEREWETTSKSYNKEFKRFYTVPERETPLEEELAKYLSREELEYILTTKNRAGQLLALQGRTLKEIHDEGLIDGFKFAEMHSTLREFFNYQGKSERIKNFPYPRQYATINLLFVRLFCLLLPFGMLREFDKLNEIAAGSLQGKMVWLVIPFSTLISWIYTSLEQVGESTENPFEGNANDVPISQMSRSAEIDMREILGETRLPPPLLPQNHIIL